MQAECLICKAPLEYLQEDVTVVCAICHKEEMTKIRCIQGHYVCDDCHMAGMDSILGLCLAERSKDPIGILEGMMSMPFCHMHGPEHHVMVGAALLTAYHNAGGFTCPKPFLKSIAAEGRSPVEAVDFGAPAERASAPECSFLLSQEPRLWRIELGGFPTR